MKIKVTLIFSLILILGLINTGIQVYANEKTLQTTLTILNNDTTLSGYVYDNFTSQPIPNITVWIVVPNIEGFPILYTDITNETGYYSMNNIQLSEQGEGNYYTNFYDPNYAYKKPQYLRIYLVTNENNVYDFSLIPQPPNTPSCGDANHNGHGIYGNISLSDCVYLLNYAFFNGSEPIPYCAGDANGDGSVNIGDVLPLIKYLYRADVPAPVDYCCDLRLTKSYKNPTTSKSVREKFNDIENIMKVESKIGAAGMQDLTLYVEGSWNTSLGGYGIILYFDSSKVNLIDFSVEGTVGEDALIFPSTIYTNPSRAAALLFSAIPPGSGRLFKITLNILETAPTGNTSLVLLNLPNPPESLCVYALADGSDDILPTLVAGNITIVRICGDVNADAQVNVGDAVYLINYIFKGGPEPIPELCQGDANGDGQVNVGDAVYLINYVFKGGSAPVENCCA